VCCCFIGDAVVTGLYIKMFGGMMLLVAGAYVTHLSVENDRLHEQVASQQSIIEEQANYSQLMSDTLETRELQLEQLQNTMLEMHHDWTEYRETVEDACINRVHPNLHKWLPNQPNSYFDGDTPPRLPVDGI